MSLVEIDENLIRRELTKDERSKLTNRKVLVLETIANQAGRKLGKGGKRNVSGKNQRSKKSSICKLQIDLAEPTPAQVIAADNGVSPDTVYRDNRKTKMAEATFDEPTLSQFRASKLHTEANVKRYHGIADSKGKEAALAEFEADKLLLAAKKTGEKTEAVEVAAKKPDKPHVANVASPTAPAISEQTLRNEIVALFDRIALLTSRGGVTLREDVNEMHRKAMT